MDIALYIFGGFAALVIIFIGFIAWRVMKTPLGEGEGLHGSGPGAADVEQHRERD